MRINRGLFRLWVVASVLWIASVGVITWKNWPVDDWVPVWAVEDEDITWDKPASDTRAHDEHNSTLPDAPWVKPAPRKPRFDPSKPFTIGKQTYANSEAFVAAERRDALVNGTGIAFAPPLVAFILGMSLIWVVRGFRSEQG
jgi:hypothetical protein